MVELAEIAVLCQVRIPRCDKVLKWWQWHFQFPCFEEKEKRKCTDVYSFLAKIRAHTAVFISFIFLIGNSNLATKNP